MGVLDGLVKTAGTLVTKFGRNVTIRTYSEVYDPATGTNALTPTDVVVKAIVEDYPAKDAKGGTTTTDGIVRGDRRVTIAANAVSAAPNTETKVLIDSLLYAVVKVDTQYATDDAAVYVMQCRK